MVGLGIVLESQQGTTITSASNNRSAQVITKVLTINKKPTPPSSPHFKSSFRMCSFLDQCFLCKTALLLDKDIYMYKGDKAFCSEECRCKQIFMDEEDQLEMMNKTATPKVNNGRDTCSLAGKRPSAGSTSSPCLRKSRYNLN